MFKKRQSPESDMWKKWQPAFKLMTGDRYDRIESAHGIGIPDVTFTLQDRHFWMELKVMKEKNLRNWTLTQRSWLFSRNHAGAPCLLFLRIPKQFFTEHDTISGYDVLMTPDQTRFIGNKILEETLDEALFIHPIHVPVSREKMVELQRLLCKI